MRAFRQPAHALTPVFAEFGCAMAQVRCSMVNGIPFQCPCPLGAPDPPPPRPREWDNSYLHSMRFDDDYDASICHDGRDAAARSALSSAPVASFAARAEPFRKGNARAFVAVTINL